MNLPIDIEETHPVFKAWFAEIDTQKDNKITQTEMLNYMNKFTHPLGKQFVVVRLKDDKKGALPAKSGEDENLPKLKPKSTIFDDEEEEEEEEEKPKEEAKEETGGPLNNFFNSITGEKKGDDDIVVDNSEDKKLNKNYNSEAEFKEHQPKATAEDVKEESAV